ncbi:MAG: hypothetical protein NT106_05280 [Candidatus Sumerlaeota bacterium]|nr:hypothetical protein [Candidatus Sumerlaeota bacterium]
MTEKKNIKSIGLVSGGLDSVLAAKLMVDQGIHVIGLHIITPFMGSYSEERAGETLIDRQARAVGFDLRRLYPGEEYIEIIKNPRWGYGSCMNPCIDCHIYFLQRAKEVMEEEGAQFVFTGEVLEQRPKSQKRNLLRMVEKRSGLEGYLLRPLTAHRLEPTIPEKLEWVERERLLNLAGRNRKPQIALAEKLGIREYQTPAGGCLLTEPNFSRRLKDLFDHGVWDIDSIQMLKVGRHFRLGPHTKLVTGRNENDNCVLANLALETDALLEAEGGGSPLSILRGETTEEMIRLAAAITRRFSRAKGEPTAVVRIHIGRSGETREILPDMIDETVFEQLRVV